MTTDNPCTPPSSVPVQRRHASLLWPLAIVAASAVGLSGFLLAHSLPGYLSEHGMRSVGQGILLAGAIPWFLQWCSLAIFFGTAIRYFNCLDRRITCAALLVPLAIGAAWWMGIAGAHWEDDPMEFLLDWTMWATMREIGAEPIGQAIIHEVIGPMVCPLTLRGPCLLNGWAFAWTALSTCLWFCLFAWMFRVLDASRLRSVRQVLLVFAFAFGVTLPVLLRAVLGVLHHAPPM